MQRRDFLKVSAAGAAVICSPSLIVGELRADDGRLYKSYNRVMLVDETGNALKYSKINQEQAYIFNYPYVSTPVMLINLHKRTRKEVSLTSADGRAIYGKAE